MSLRTIVARAFRTAVVLGLAAAPRLAAQDAVVEGDLGRRLDSAVTAAERVGFSGAVLVLRGGTTILHRGAGLAVESPRRPYGRATVVPIGSNVKDFTKTAILQLAEAGRLTLDDSLARFFPEAPTDKRGITIRQLLDFRSGLPLGIGSDDERLDEDAWRARMLALPLESAPGTTERYSNVGYSVLAAIVQRVAGMPYERYLAEHIFAPAGMTETGLLLPRLAATRLAHAYAAGQDQGTMLDKPRVADGTTWNLRGNGGLVSTLEDMAKFYHALTGGSTLLREAADRERVVRSDQPVLMAGSDLVSFFMYGRFPGAGVEVFLASNHAAAPAPRLLDELLPILGIQSGRRRNRMEGPAATAAAHPGFPETGAGRTVAAWFEAYNTGDTARMRRFFEEHGDTGPGAPPIATRLDRYRQMRENLGTLTVQNVEQTADGIAVRVSSSGGDPATLTFQVEPSEPFRLRGVRVEVG